ncbi:MAG: DUF1616 domain-containing protein [Halapricum sp.]
MTDGDAETGISPGTMPIDLLAVVSLVSITALLAYPPFEPPALFAPLRTMLGLLSVLFAPGYATLAALLPHSGEVSESDPSEWVTLPGSRGVSSSRWTAAGLSRLEWVGLSVLVSAVVVSILGILLSLASIRIGPSTIVLTVTGYTLLLVLVAALRRWVSDEGTFDPPIKGFGSSFIRVKAPRTRVDALLNLLLLFLVLVGGAVVVAPSVGQDTAEFTEFYVLSGNEADDPTMGEYLSTAGPNDTTRIQAVVANREHRRLNYTIVVQVQRADLADRSVRVLDRRQASRFSVELAHNESVRVPYRFTVSEAETSCRVAFLLYVDDVPTSPTIGNAYRELHLWHTADPPGGGGDCLSLNAVDVRVAERA